MLGANSQPAPSERDASSAGDEGPPKKSRKLDSSLFGLKPREFVIGREVTDTQGVIYSVESFNDITHVPSGGYVIRLRVKDTGEPVVLILDDSERV
jgi:hypothetical protein